MNPVPARAPGGDETTQYARSPADLLGVVLAVGGLVVMYGLIAALPAGSEQFSRDVLRFVGHLPRVLMVAIGLAAAVATVVLLVVVAVPLVRHTRRDALNAVVAGVAAAVGATAAVAIWHHIGGPVADAVLRGTDGSSLVRDAALVAALTASGSFRQSPWTRWCAVSLGVLIVSGIGIAELTPIGALTAILGGWALGLLSRFAFGSTVRRPSVSALVARMQDAGVRAAFLERSPERPTSLAGELEDGSPISVTALGREARGSRVWHRIWEKVRLRTAASGYQPIGVWSALATRVLADLLAESAGVHAPRSLLFTQVEPETAVLVETVVRGEPIGPGIAPAQAERLFAALRALHRAGVAHRDLRAEQLACEGEMVGFRSLEQATVAAGDLVRRVDVAQLLTTLGTLLGPQAAVEAMRTGYRPADETRIIGTLQPIALIGWGWRESRAARGCLDAVRQELAKGVMGDLQKEVEAERIERFRPRTVLLVVAMTLAAYFLIGQLSKVNLAKTLSDMNPWWFLVACVGSAITYVGSSINLIAFVPGRVSVAKGALAELSGAFIGLVTPPTVGHVAVNARFLAKQGVDGGAAAGAIAVSQIVNVIVTVVLIFATALLAGTGVGHVKIVPGPRVLLVLGVIVAAGGIVMAIPPARRAIVKRVWPRVRSAVPQLLDTLSRPLRLVAGVGGNLLLTGGYVLALVASLEAVGAHPPIIGTAAVYMAGNAVGTAAPTPGGIGAVEAVLSAGLTAIGIPAHEALAGVLLFRVATFWLPIPPGWVTFYFLQRAGQI